MSPGQHFDCIFCLAPEGLELRIDKRGRPFFLCGVCGSRSFIHGNGLRGPQILWGKLTLALRGGEADVAQELVRREVTREQHRTGH